MSALDDLIKLIQDDDLRGRLKAEFDKLRKRKKFGLVFESKDEYATLPNRVVKLGDTVYPTLTKLDEVCNAPEDNLWHVLIEAENFHALQLLKYLYAGKVDCIYIDPPYNTGARDWKYNDNYVDAADTFRHSKWLSMMERRLKLAKELLSDSGAIFISIDDNEQATLKLLCDDIFGVKNFVDIFSWKKTETPANLSIKTKKAIEYILCYTKTNSSIKFRGLKKESKSNNGLMNQTNSAKELTFPPDCVDTALADGIYAKGEYGTAAYKIFLLDDTEVKNGVFVKPIRLHGKFKWSQEKLNAEILQGTKVSIRTKAFSPSYERTEYEPEVPWNIIDKTFGVQTNEHASTELKKIFGGQKVFDFPKPHSLIEYLINFLGNKNSLVLDFFAGSGTTLHAVNLLNAQDGGKRRCILVTNNEVSDAEAKTLRKQGLTPDDDAWQALGIARHVTWQRTVCSIEGHDINGTPLSGNYLGTDLPMADGFKANAVFFKLDYLDKDNVALGKSFKELLPVLWLKAGGIGECPTLDAEEPFKIFAANRFAVLLDEKRFKEFTEALRGTAIDTVFIVTGSKTALNRMRKLSNVPQCVQLYGDYLKHFNRKEATR